MNSINLPPTISCDGKGVNGIGGVQSSGGGVVFSKGCSKIAGLLKSEMNPNASEYYCPTCKTSYPVDSAMIAGAAIEAR